ncbi:hypothetical protein [Streptomyces sp. NBC_01763]|uniref:hypothetical protein n=1 Tax=Streptomyces sp. NBC_01763 TaxID=2975934 RepID=UPI002DD84390|nr:hypothetical protein [Streptomyces sp. NBC_01763]WSC35633.1 hypothetical protein OHA08_09050 [Streptomyces sp. NBC_01763]
MNANLKAATRATLLAGIIRGRTKGHPEATALRAIATNLTRAAGILRKAADSDRLSDDADQALWRARMTAARAETGIPAAVIDYVSALAIGYEPDLPDLLPADPEHVRQENELRARFLDLSRHLDARDEDVANAVLVALIRLHSDYDRLADDVALHGRADQLPTTYRPHEGTRTAVHLPGHLTVFDGGLILAELAVPFAITPGEIWQLIKSAQPARDTAAAFTDGLSAELAAA